MILLIKVEKIENGYTATIEHSSKQGPRTIYAEDVSELQDAASKLIRSEFEAKNDKV